MPDVHNLKYGVFLDLDVGLSGGPLSPGYRLALKLDALGYIDPLGAERFHLIFEHLKPLLVLLGGHSRRRRTSRQCFDGADPEVGLPDQHSLVITAGGHQEVVIRRELALGNMRGVAHVLFELSALLHHAGVLEELDLSQVVGRSQDCPRVRAAGRVHMSVVNEWGPDTFDLPS